VLRLPFQRFQATAKPGEGLAITASGSATLEKLPDFLAAAQSIGRAPAGDVTRPVAAEDVQYVTLDKIAAIVNRNKKTMERLKKRKSNPLPDPAVEGGGGKPDEWIWSNVRPWLEKEFNRPLPEQYPTLRQ
jgi:hypothetical protein